jgi:hypothetical protein
MGNELPTLWQIPVSHYSEKARWALSHKEIEHERRSPLPGSHMLVALWLTRGAQYTLPVLTLDGRHIGDSTAIIAELERRRPDPPLYPADPTNAGAPSSSRTSSTRSSPLTRASSPGTSCARTAPASGRWSSRRFPAR